jgi:cytoskeletal protein RodZ
VKEIGEIFRETRENIGISIEEVADDLKVNVDQIKNIEEGNIKAFENVVSLKYFIKDYAKYLGLDYEKMVDDYNEFLFDCTSKISLEDIKEAKRRIMKEKGDKNNIKSPYTSDGGKYKIVFVIVSIFILILIILFALLIINYNKENVLKGGIVNEYSEQINYF